MQTRYPSAGKAKRAPGKSGRAIVAFYGPRPPLGSFTKENAAFFVFIYLKDKPSHARSRTWEGYEADFFGANSVASALGIRSGATPGGPRCQQPNYGADSNSRRPARCNPVGRLL